MNPAKQHGELLDAALWNLPLREERADGRFPAAEKFTDALGRAVSVSTPLGVTSNFYDGTTSRILRVTRTGSSATLYAYDALGGTVETAYDSLGQTLSLFQALALKQAQR